MPNCCNCCENRKVCVIKIVWYYLCFFFFSSRRRHTRFDCDWSSDVCSSDLGAWTDYWGARWNYQLFASRGYIVAAVNFHGSTGYGQKFTDAISRHWGDYPYEDLMKGLDQVARLPYVDSTRMGAAGASYGGYMGYWVGVGRAAGRGRG